MASEKIGRDAVVVDVVDRLMAHWDSVVVLCSGPGQNGTTTYKFSGGGNVFAQVGMAEAFINRNRESMEVEEELNLPGEESEA